jgi:hypothetical protein
MQNGYKYNTKNKNMLKFYICFQREFKNNVHE